jgi:hypothetical protein
MPTLEELDGEVWGEPDYPSHLVTTCHRLRKKDLDDFTIEDLRIMVGQGIALEHLVPRVLARLRDDPLAGGDFYSGDLLSALIREGNRAELGLQADGVRQCCRRALEHLAAISDGSLPDGRFVGDDLAATLRAEINAYLES